MDPRLATDQIKAVARGEGFDLVGVAAVTPIDPAPLDRWLGAGWDADLDYVRNSRDARLDVERLLPGARSVVAVAVSYRHGEPTPSEEPSGLVARYARGRDYHNVMRRPLKRLREAIQRLVPGSRTYTSCDARPVMEKVWAQRAGLGSIGKNGCLIAPPFGSFVLLGTVVTSAELVPDIEHSDRCGTCVACLSSCPTDAIPEPRFIDARKCIAYHTIEHQDPLPPEISSRLGGRLFGCDACQDVCPWNRREQPTGGKLHEALRPHEGQALIPLRFIRESSDEALAARAHATPLARAGVAGLRRTAEALLQSSDGAS